jgi:hypothetical protein
MTSLKIRKGSVLQLQDQNTNFVFVNGIGWGRARKTLQHTCFGKRNKVPLSRPIVREIITNPKQGEKGKGIL